MFGPASLDMTPFPELTALVRNVVDSHPTDRDEHGLNVCRLRELCDYAARAEARELAAALEAALRLVEVLASPVASLERDQVHAVACELLRALAGEGEPTASAEPEPYAETEHAAESSQAPAVDSVPMRSVSMDSSDEDDEEEPAASKPSPATTSTEASDEPAAAARRRFPPGAPSR